MAVAWNRLQAVQTWATEKGTTPWTTYQTSLAQAESDNVVAVGNAEYGYTAAAIAAQSTRTHDADSDQKAVSDAIAGAAKGEADDIADAQLSQATEVTNAEIAYAHSTADHTTTHDKAATAIDQGYANEMSLRKQTLQDALTAALGTEQNASARRAADRSELDFYRGGS